ncbi:MAG: N-acetyltransferase [Myxococcales bacterium]|nr:MAG: N-acetyltransferase [Myxococcales bacterium]
MSTPVSLELPDLPAPWAARPPVLDDLPRLLELRGTDKSEWTGSVHVDEAAVESEVAGLASWSRRQLVVVGGDDVPVAWVTVQDRAGGRTMVHLYVDRSIDQPESLAAPLYAWVEKQAIDLAVLRELSETRLDASPFADDTEQLAWLAAAGYTKRRTWLHMDRPVTPDEATSLPAPRAGVRVRRVETHDNGMPMAHDLHVVHRMLEESFEDHFNSYRESFSEFVQRMREMPGHRWDHWWIAEIEWEEDGETSWVPGGALVCSVIPAHGDSTESSYVEYIGVHRLSRGRGVAKALLHTVIADAAERGRDTVSLEVDNDSPTGADGLYRSLGWEVDYVTDSWFKDLHV